MPFVGRRRELQRLQERLDDLRSGRGGLVLVTGEPGVGKTSLTREFAERAGAVGACVLAAGCFEGESQGPYQLWVEVLEGRAATVDAAMLRDELGPGGGLLSRLSPAVGATLPHGPSAPAALTADDERRRLFDAFTHWLGRLALATSTVVVLEDLQWADPDSLALFRRVARSAAGMPLLLVATHRAPESPTLADVLAFVSREADLDRIGLSGFSPEEVAEYLAVAAGGPVPSALVAAIHSETAGNPFFVREVLNHLVEEDKIARRGDRWVSGSSMADLGIPEGVRRVVRQRAGRLSRTAQELLGLASGFTAGIDPVVLAEVADQPEATVLESLDEATAAGLLRPTANRPPRYDFSHAIVRHALYDGLTAGRRRDLHGRVAAALSHRPLTGTGAAELAAQYYQAGAREGVEHCVAAAAQAREAHAHQQAVRLLRMAVELDHDQDPRLLARLAVAEAEALQLAAAATSAARALDGLARAHADARVGLDEVLAFVVTVGRLLKESGAPLPAWEPLVDRGLALVGDRRDLAWARLRLLRIPVEPMVEGPVHAGRWLGHDPEAVSIALADGAEDDHARTIEPWDWRSRSETEEVIGLARAWRNPPSILRAYEAANRSLLFRHGDLAATERLMEELLDAALRWGSAAALGEALTQLALCHALQGDVQRSGQELDEARGIVEPLGALHRQHLAVSVSHAVLVRYLGAPVEPGWAELGERAAQLVGQPRLARAAPLGLIMAAVGAMAWAMAGDRDRAAALVDPLTALLERSQSRDYGMAGSLWMVVAACWQLRRADLVARHDALIGRAVAEGVPAGPFTSWLLARARLADLRGDRTEATRLWDAAAVELDAVGHGTLAAMARTEGGRTAEASSSLTAREAEILALIAAGHTNQEIAARLHLSVATVNRHVANVYLKIGARNRASATAFAVTHGLA